MSPPKNLYLFDIYVGGLQHRMGVKKDKLPKICMFGVKKAMRGAGG
jgi:hypothetical protein